MTKTELEQPKKAAHILDKEQSRTCYNDEEADVFDYASDVLQAAIRAASLALEEEDMDQGVFYPHSLDIFDNLRK